MEGDPAGMNEWTAEEAEQYENEFEAESPRPAMSPEEVSIFPCVGQGLMGVWLLSGCHQDTSTK